MSIESDCILWNKEEADVAGSMISEVGFGPDFSVAGAPTFPAGKFNNALCVDANTEIVQVANTPGQFNFGTGMFEVWFRTTVAIINGKSQGGQKPRLCTWWKDSNEYMQWGFHNTVGMYWNIQDAVSIVSWNNTDAGLDIPANTLAHLLMVWDRNGIGGGANVRRTYLNGVQVGSDNVVFADTDMTTAEFSLNILYNGSYIVSNPVDTDNFKWYPTVTEQAILDVIANMNNEGWPVVGGVRMLDGGLLRPNMLESVLIK